MEKVMVTMQRLCRDIYKTEEGWSHAEAVKDLALKLAGDIGERPDFNALMLVAWLHEADNPDFAGYPGDADSNLEAVLLASPFTYSYGTKIRKAVESLKAAPTSVEAKLVHDADLCLASGAISLLAMSDLAKMGDDPDASPVWGQLSKMISIKRKMKTDAGRREAATKENHVIQILNVLFEEKPSDAWSKKLGAFLSAV